MMPGGSMASEGFPRKGALVLALETSGRLGSVALGEGPVGRAGSRVRVLGRRRLEEDEEHASLLLPRIQELLDEVEVGCGDLSGLIVGAGPGSFTGVRVGVATAKGMARALGIPLWAFSSLAAAAVDLEASSPPKSASPASDPTRPRCVLFDARGGRVYAAAYRVSGQGAEVLLEPRASTVREMCDGLIPPGALLMGDGAVKHKAVFEASGLEVLLPPAGTPTAEGHLRLLALDPRAHPLDDPGGWEPEYLRASGAERMHMGPGGPGSS